MIGRLSALVLGFALTAHAADPPLVFPIREGDLHGLIDRQGKVILPIEFSQPLQVSDGLIMATKGAKTAYFDVGGKMVIRPQDQTRGPFAEGLAPAIVTDAAGKQALGYVDRDLKTVIRGDFKDVGPFSDGMADVAVADEWGVVKRGYIDKAGKLVVPAKYEKTFPFAGGLGRVAPARDQFRLVDKTGPRRYARGHRLHRCRGRGHDPRLERSQGRLHEHGGQARDSAAVRAVGRVQRGHGADSGRRTPAGGRFGYIDKTGKVVIPPRFTTAEAFSDGVALVKEDGSSERTVFIDKTGKVVLRHEFDRVYPFTTGRAVFKSGNRYGYIDKSGKIVIPATWSFARPFTGPLAAVVDGRQSAYIDVSGKVVWRSDRQ